MLETMGTMFYPDIQSISHG